MQFINWLSKKVLAGVIIPWCAIFSLSAQPSASGIIKSGDKPAVFLQEGINTPNDESTPSFTPDGKTLYLCNDQKICVSKWVNHKWTTPQVVAFSGHWKDWDPFISPDGKRIIFVSNRPVPGAPAGQKNNHLWYADRLSGDKWSAPVHIDGPVNVNGVVAYAPCLTRRGTVSFCSRNRDGYKGMGGYWAKWQVDHYEKPQRLILNGNNDIFDPFISPDERYLIFASNGKLYISYRAGDGWSQGQELGPEVNDGGDNGSPYVSPDGKTLYYSGKAQGISMIPIHLPSN